MATPSAPTMNAAPPSAKVAATSQSGLAAIALNRFGLGARPNDTPPTNPKGWLRAQFAAYQPRPDIWAAQPDSGAIATLLDQKRKQAMEGAASNSDPVQREKDARRAAMDAVNMTSRDLYQQAVNARVMSALTTPTPFIERLVHFWSNHFAISVDKGEAEPYAGAFETEAIRPFVLGRFEDMLLAVERHPAMQLFLDQVNSIGPNSPAALRAKQRNAPRNPGLNENLAREIMELHTLGVRSGYTQADVTEFARAMTGWSVMVKPPAKPGDNPPAGAFVFRPPQHEPGDRTIMGRHYAQTGEDQAQAVMHDLAQSSATARHIATKLARHFIADTPPPEAVEALAQAFTRSRGDLPTVYDALIASEAAWRHTAAKFKTPWEWAISSLRGLGIQDPVAETGNQPMAALFIKLGQPVWRPGSPAGYDDIAASWAAPDALMRRVEFAQRVAARIGDRLDARQLAQKLLPGVLNPATGQAVSRAESAPMALALLLVSPDFQRR
ncbi:DUF1800 domain-containing protein [Musicola paradisiaca]|uniref:DUF1800 domain-containing protein n=1 Tax=Musicola paradisiaca (strain Ech703) TaxID=579405 RepID=C6C3A4_MUSP7|nr:DUF1800 domain-containing protein [Musicola paradisiaca]ACS87202.1 Protein of unknown function DUF1800 [Musicola paradisiaca Ech703]